MKDIIGIICAVVAAGGVLMLVGFITYDIVRHCFCKPFDFNKPFDNLIPTPKMKPPKEPKEK